MQSPAEESEEEEEEDDAREVAGQKDRAVVSAEVSDMDYLKSRVTKALSDDEDDDNDAPEDPQARQYPLSGSTIKFLPSHH